MGNYRHLEINDDVRAEVTNPELDLKEMEYCVLSSQIELRELVASNPKLLGHFAHWMSKDIEHSVRAALSGNTSIDPSIVVELSNDPHLAVISAASENPNLNQQRLSELAEHRSYIVRTGVARNSGASLETLKQLAKDSEWGVRRSVAENPNVSIDLLSELSKEEVDEIQIAVASNIKTTMQTLSELWVDSSAARDTVISNPNCTEEFLLSALKEAMALKDDQDETWDDDLRGDTSIRELIAERPNLSRSLILELIVDPSHYVRQKIAANVSLTQEDLSKLSLDENENVRQAVVDNPNTSQESKTAATLLGLPSKESDDE
jgi:hypothetical protein